ncbi:MULTISPECIES: DUF4262 domain-containing protein [Actinokineospora]|uniref:DUF4262 domain-containing protein n=1 Tax=Actinokineospora fastidiosa TaxID=1816 RepID=A0A918GP17_9PSEU|nr:MULTISPECIES: DUF4262 domain-containing protein [Actinokineospora]UVS78239.1 hypothetical protein Actkin_01967 [Actinokineospora sp. UTMC 2448]GGS48645.1 hypothetical protein GCM10010171_49700 [Actinokineospora fastidiosa]
MSLPALTPDEEQLREWLLHTADQDGYAAVEVAGDADGAPYAFTVGVWRRFAAPEAVVVGLPVDMARPLLDLYVRRTAEGERFYPGLPYLDFFEGTPVVVERVHKGHYPEFFGSAFLVYPQGDFPAMQLIVATPDGRFPWSPDAPDGFDIWQPVLTYTGRPETWRPGIDGP